MVEYRRERDKNLWQNPTACICWLKKKKNLTCNIVSTRLNPRELRHTLQFCYGAVTYKWRIYPFEVLSSKHPQFGYVNLEWSLSDGTAKVVVPLYRRHFYMFYGRQIRCTCRPWESSHTSKSIFGCTRRMWKDMQYPAGKHYVRPASQMVQQLPERCYGCTKCYLTYPAQMLIVYRSNN